MGAMLVCAGTLRASPLARQALSAVEIRTAHKIDQTRCAGAARIDRSLATGSGCDCTALEAAFDSPLAAWRFCALAEKISIEAPLRAHFMIRAERPVASDDADRRGGNPKPRTD